MRLENKRLGGKVDKVLSICNELNQQLLNEAFIQNVKDNVSTIGKTAKNLAPMAMTLTPLALMSLGGLVGLNNHSGLVNTVANSDAIESGNENKFHPAYWTSKIFDIQRQQDSSGNDIAYAPKQNESGDIVDTKVTPEEMQNMKRSEYHYKAKSPQLIKSEYLTPQLGLTLGGLGAVGLNLNRSRALANQTKNFAQQAKQQYAQNRQLMLQNRAQMRQIQQQQQQNNNQKII